MKSMKQLKETLTLPWTLRIESSRFFYELAHGIVCAFMVDSLVWRLPISFMVKRIPFHGSAFRGSEVSTNCGTRHAKPVQPSDRRQRVQRTSLRPRHPSGWHARWLSHKDLRWIPLSLLGEGKRRFACGEAVCCLYEPYELCQEWTP